MNITNEEAIDSLRACCKRWPWCVAMVSGLILALVLTSIFCGHTLFGWQACFQLFDLLLQPVLEAIKVRR